MIIEATYTDLKKWFHSEIPVRLKFWSDGFLQHLQLMNMKRVGYNVRVRLYRSLGYYHICCCELPSTDTSNKVLINRLANPYFGESMFLNKITYIFEKST